MEEARDAAPAPLRAGSMPPSRTCPQPPPCEPFAAAEATEEEELEVEVPEPRRSRKPDRHPQGDKQGEGEG